MKNKEKILVKENAAQSSAFIEDFENKYISAINGVFDGIVELGIESPTRSMVLDAIKGNFDEIRSAYNEFTRGDLESVKTRAAKENLKELFARELQNFINKVNNLFSRTIGNTDSPEFPDFDTQSRNAGSLAELAESTWGHIPARSEDLIGFVDFDKTGRAFLSDVNKDKIRDLFSEFIDDPNEILILKTQKEVAGSLQTLINACEDFGIKTRADVNTVAFMRFFFDVSIEDGHYKVTPKELSRLTWLKEDKE